MYKLIKQEYVDEVASDAIVLEHIETGAKVLVLSNNDENKAFGIGFKTIPEDSTGVAHIVEHCVLSGSRKYTTREPFMDLIKSSMQTFLNAMTFPDKTIYPVSSRNEKDFYNLMDVYLDAVFYPRIYDKKEIFEQEGWHYELDENENIIYNGVVYNEMKGVYSDPQNIVSDLVTFNLHKNSSYGVDSGGNPKDIPNLSYEDFLKFHKKHYHPSNSYIYLYGDLDYERVLQYIENNYLLNFKKEDLDPTIHLNSAFEIPEEIEATYGASESEMKGNKDYLAMSWCLGDRNNKLDTFMTKFLSELLIDSDASPLKRALLESNFCEDVYAETSSSLPLDLTIIAKHTDANKVDEFKNIIKTSLQNIVEHGIDKDLLVATLNKFEFSLREGGGSQRAIIYYIRALDTWLYGSDPIDALKTNEIVEKLREKIDTDFFQTYIDKKILNNNFSITVSVRPELNKNLKEDKELEEKLAKFKESLTDYDLSNIKKAHENLIAFQMTEDSEEDKATIPTLELSDIKNGVTHIPREVIKKEYGELLFNEQFTNAISYVNLSFDTSHIKTEDLYNLSILTDLIGKLSTKNYKYDELDSKIYTVMGGMNLIPLAYKDLSSDSKTNFKRRMNLNFKTLDVNFKESIDLINEIISTTKFTEKNRIKEILLSEKSASESEILQNGHAIASQTVQSYYNAHISYNCKLNGLDNYFYLSELVEHFDERYDELVSSLERIRKEVFNSKNLIINLTTSREGLDEQINLLDNLALSLPSVSYEVADYEFTEEAKNQGFTTSANVQYVSKGYDISKFGLKYDGSMQVLASILSSDYLHNNIRAKGGAYGAGAKLSLSSDFVTYSYRDPQLKNTVDIYNNIYEFVENLNLSKDDLKNYIIGSINSFDPLISPQAASELNLLRYMSNITEEMMEEFKTQALNTTLDKLKSMSSALKKAMEQNFICVIGGEEKIKESSELFKEITSLKK